KVVEEYEQDFADTAMMVSQLDASLRAMTRAALPTSDLTEAVRQFAESMTVRLTPLLEVQAQSITELVNDSVLFAMQEGNLAAKGREMAAGAETLSDANISYAHLAEQIKALDRVLHRIDVASVRGESADEATQRYVETGGIVEVRV